MYQKLGFLWHVPYTQRHNITHIFTMHQIHNGPLKRLLEKYLTHTAPVQRIEIPQDIKDEVRLGNLQEDFQITNLQGEGKDLERRLLGLVEKLYGFVNLTLHREVRCGVCEYCINGKEGGVGVLLTYTFGRGARELSVTCQNFHF